jgi:hypothetical protein
MCIAGWLLATVIFWGASLSKLAELDYLPMAQNSSTVNLLRLKWNQLDQLAYKRSQLSAGMGSLMWASAPLAAPPPKSEIAGSDEVNVVPATPELSTPSLLLSGIVHVATESGKHFYSALIEGNLYSPKERILDVLIEEITSKGITVSRRGQRWFIPVPDVYYTIHRSP